MNSKNNKIAILYFLFFLLALNLKGQTENENYIISFRPDSAVTDLNKLTVEQRHPVVQYMDGFGRLKQTVSVAITPVGADLVQPVVYDVYGRESKQYLPFAASQNGAYHTSATESANWQNHYGDTEKAYAFFQKKFDGSPLNRVVEQGAPGITWQPKAGSTDFSGHTLKMEYGSNLLEDEVIHWVLDDAEQLEKASGEFYSPNQLYKTVSKDENWTSGRANTKEEYKDKLGQVVLKRSYLDENTSIETYYVYDDYGLLRYVIPPKAVEIYRNGSSAYCSPGSGFKVITKPTSLDSVESGVFKYFVKQGASLSLQPGFQFKASTTQSLVIKSEELNREEFNELIYCYRYDERKRMVYKKLPGAAPVYMVYDDRDRLVATQDGNQRGQSKWLVTKYDKLNRPVITAFYGSSKNQVDLQKEVNDFYAIATNPMFESRLDSKPSSLKSYNNKSFPNNISDADVLTATYYDDYTFDHCPQGAYDQSQLAASSLVTALLPAPKGQLTGTWVKTLNADTDRPGGLWAVNFYDKKYRVVQTRSQNYLGGYDRITQVYDFVGKAERSIHEHVVGGKAIVENKWFDYDHAGRLTKVEQQYSGAVSKSRTILAGNHPETLAQEAPNRKSPHPDPPVPSHER